MTMKLTRIALALALGATAPAFADRYVCRWGDLPEIYTPDSVEMAMHFDGARGGLRPPTTQLPITLPALAAVPAVNVTVPIDPNAAMSRVVTAAAPTTATVVTRGADLAPPNPGPPSQAFIDALKKVYSASVQAEVDQVWGLFQREPAALPIDQRVGNAVVRFIVRLGKAPGADSTARPDLLKPNATRATVRSANGVGVRSAPWGAPGGAALGSGASIELVPPATGPWYQVKSGGWVAGIWLDLQ